MSSAYDLATGDSPVVFKELEHVYPHFSKDEAKQLYSLYVERLGCANWDDFENSLLKLGALAQEKFHVVVVYRGLKLLDELKKLPWPNSLDESQAVTELRGAKFLTLLDRCFGMMGMESDFDANALQYLIAEAVLSESGLELSDDKSLAPLVRAGILSPSGKFSCIVAHWYYNRKCFPLRAQISPDLLEYLVKLAVRNMSAKRFRETLVDGFPKGATFQHLFNEAMSMLLPLHQYIIPEFNTFTVDEDGSPIHGRELDFYINSQLQWALELLRKGDKIGARFDQQVAKYREVQAQDYLVVDCRGPKTRSVAGDHYSRCTLYFADDFTSCVCKMRMQQETTLYLQP